MTETPIIDAHVHVFQPTIDYPWIQGEFQNLWPPAPPESILQELQRHDVAGAILIQAVSDPAETVALLRLGEHEPLVKGVVGWLDLTALGRARDSMQLDSLNARSLLVGLRHQLTDEDNANWIANPSIVSSLRVVAGRGLAFDLLITQRELPSVIEVARAVPDLTLIVDHCAKPDLKRELSVWRDELRQLACIRPNIFCKLSGLATQAPSNEWSPELLLPYYESALDMFGPNRCMFGSDWPVAGLRGSYSDVIGLMEQVTAGLSRVERDQVLGGTASGAYGLLG